MGTNANILRGARGMDDIDDIEAVRAMHAKFHFDFYNIWMWIERFK